MKRYIKYCAASATALALTILCTVASVLTLPTFYQQQEPTDAVSVWDDVGYEYANCTVSEDGTVEMTGADPQIYLYGIDESVQTLCVKTAQPIPSGTRCQLYYVPDGCTPTEELSVVQTASEGQTELLFTVEEGTYEAFRLDVDADYQIDDVLVSQQIPTTAPVKEVRLNWIQISITFVLLEVQALLIAWQWERLQSWGQGRVQAYRTHCRAFWCAVAMFAAAVALSIVIWLVLGAAGVIAANGYNCLYFVAAGVVLGGLLALRRQLGEHPERLFLVLTICIGMIYAVVSPNATIVSLDDESHYRQALRVSYGGTTYYTDADYAMTNQKLSNELSLAAEHSRNEQLNEMYAEGASAVAKTNIVSLDKLAYLPSAAGMWLARSAGASFTVIFTAGRIANMLSYAIIMYFAIKRLRSGGMLLVVFALLPTLIFTAGNYSYDGWCVAFLALGTAIFLDEYRHPERAFSWPTMAGMLVCLALGCIPKAIYFPVFLMTLFVPREKFASEKQRKRYYAVVIILTALVALSFAAPFLFTKGTAYSDGRGGENVNAARQVKFILSSPLNYAKVLLGYLFGVYFRPSFFMPFSVELQGYLPAFRLGVPVVILLLVVFVFDRSKRDVQLHQPSLLLKLMSALSFFCAVCLAATAMYVAYTSVGSGTIQGCQSRYMLPVLLPALVLVRPNRIWVPVPEQWYHFAVLSVDAALLFTGIWPLVACMM